MFDVSSDEKLNILPHKGFVDSMEFFPFIKHTLTLTKVADSVYRKDRGAGGAGGALAPPIISRNLI